MFLYLQSNAVLGQSSDSDLVYQSVPPCRLLDTRVAGGQLTAGPGGTRDFYVYGSGSLMDLQGGDSSGCTAPQGEPVAAHINFATVGSVVRGHIRVYPKDSALPNTANVNFVTGFAQANAVTVRTLFDVSEPEITVYAANATHVVADVQGYYYPASTALTAVDYTDGNGLEPISSDGSVTVVELLDIFAGGPGHVVVNASTVLTVLDAGDTYRCGITKNSTAKPQATMGLAAVVVPIESTVAASQGFDVSEGLNSFRLLCWFEQGITADLGATASFPSLTAVFSPNRM